ncbi:MauE/DoxX family redox-associated membrane protein [Branchiibius sp. NY16-3462-2]|uniref:TlpA family protein disulfide reductase n=1 Tax=Branchiibius sp. NY16-3462-2 TaxID=1807500 RepID=UPI000796B09C|nr:MauE/DoxX family redox-associated membrane protein [Branchiibius sp. NY16-3462-2]KYH43752.1 hypothetical protein AZH51_02850 [Branchiibius sp. NY16-3462-2]
MDILGAILAWAVAAVLIASGALKLGRHREFFKSMQTLGLPASLLRDYTFAKAFPFIEIGLGALIVLLPKPWQLIPVALATGLFVAFLVVIVRAARSAVPASCNCFGGLGADEVGPRTVARNVGFVVLSLLALILHAAPASVAAERLGGWAYVLPALLAAGVAGGLVLYRNNAEQRTERDLITNLTLQNRDGEHLPIRELQDPPSYVVFFSAGCGACSQTVEEFRWWPHAMADGYDLVPVFTGSPEQFAMFPEFEALLDHAWYDPQMTFYKAIGGNGTPAGTLIDKDHPLGNGAVSGRDELRALIWTEEFTRERKREVESGRDDRAREMARQALIDGGWDPAWVDFAEIKLTNDDGREIVVNPAAPVVEDAADEEPASR